MRIVSYFEGVTKWSVSWDEFRPAIGTPHTKLVSVLREKYQFEQAGASPVSQQLGLFLPMLAQGKFNFKDGVVSINSLEFQPDGIVAMCPVTEASDAFLQEMAAELESELGFRLPIKQRTKSYRSTIISDIGLDFLDIIPKWKSIIDLFKKLKNAESGNIAPFALRFGGIEPNATIENEIVIERRFSAPKGEHWLFTQMSLDTASHETVLNFMETIFGPSAK